MAFRVSLVLSLAAMVCASPTKPAFWKGTPLDTTIENMRSSCSEDNSLACFQYKAFSFLDTILQGDYFNLPGKVEFAPNGYRSTDVSKRSDASLEDGIEELLKSYDIKLGLPTGGTVTVDSRSLDKEELNVKFEFSGRAVEARKKSKLKKIFIPILVFILLKAITLVPFALGVLGFKAWNSLQLAFFSFIISTGIAVFQLCQKLAADSAHAHIAAAPNAWEPAAVNHFTGKSLSDMQLAYSKYVQE
ncbi:hypothetical protein NQ318_017232 [Aromia moschata]|uniref:Osiris 19 n=1 Tax=Aromia moschata TaxID=1265417 RepID=A0AAV8YM72_9CUCU|nr:hypothetical protein NQ318_017232 [Aromia moschata]